MTKDEVLKEIAANFEYEGWAVRRTEDGALMLERDGKVYRGGGAPELIDFRRGSSLATQIVKPLETCRAFSHSSLVSNLLKMYQRDSGASF
jgi:hypothetical protein